MEPLLVIHNHDKPTYADAMQPIPYTALKFARLAQVRSISGWAARWVRTLLLLPSWAFGTETRLRPILHWMIYGVRESYLDDRLSLHSLVLQHIYLV